MQDLLCEHYIKVELYIDKLRLRFMNISTCHITHFPNFLSLLDLHNHSTKSHISIVFSNKNSNLNGKKLSIIHTKNLSTNNDASTKFSNYVNVNKTVNYVNSNNTSSEFFDY